MSATDDAEADEETAAADLPDLTDPEQLRLHNLTEMKQGIEALTIYNAGRMEAYEEAASPEKLASLTTALLSLKLDIVINQLAMLNNDHEYQMAQVTLEFLVKLSLMLDVLAPSKPPDNA